jgi:hypothetical protein
MKARYAHDIFFTFLDNMSITTRFFKKTQCTISFDDIIMLVEYQSPKAFCLPEVVLWHEKCLLKILTEITRSHKLKRQCDEQKKKDKNTIIKQILLRKPQTE